MAQNLVWRTTTLVQHEPCST